MSYLPEGLPAPAAEPDGLSAPYWSGLRDNRLRVQRCDDCGTLQFGPEWVCHYCRSFALRWTDIPPVGVIYSWERVWHPVHPALKGSTPYLVVLVEHACGVRLLGNLLQPAEQEVIIGAAVEGVFEHHDAFSLLQWQRTSQ